MCLAITEDFDDNYDEYEYREEMDEINRHNRELAKRQANNITAVEHGLEVEDEPIRTNW